MTYPLSVSRGRSLLAASSWWPRVAVQDWECGALDRELREGQQLLAPVTAVVSAPSVGQDNSGGNMLTKAQVVTTRGSFFR